MSWLYQSRRPVATKHNGTMMLSRLFGTWTLWGYDGTFQAAPYMNAVWKKSVRHLLRRNLEVRRCLILGVAMGATFDVVQRAWPDVEMVGVDWEPALFALGKKLGVFHPGANVTFIEGDAAEIVPKLEGTFDLVIIDLFNGRDVADVVSDNAFREAVTAHLSDKGVVALNCYFQRQVLEEWPPRLSSPQIIHHQANAIGIFGPRADH